MRFKTPPHVQHVFRGVIFFLVTPQSCGHAHGCQRPLFVALRLGYKPGQWVPRSALKRAQVCSWAWVCEPTQAGIHGVVQCCNTPLAPVPHTRPNGTPQPSSHPLGTQGPRCNPTAPCTIQLMSGTDTKTCLWGMFLDV